MERIVAQDLPGEAMPIPGALKSIKDIKLNLHDESRQDAKFLLSSDPQLQKSINAMFAGLDANYSLSLLEITPGKAPRYASRREGVGYQPGSVGKLAVALAVFTELEKIFPESFESRQELLRTKKVRAGKWALTDSHTVPIYDVETQKLVKRPVVESDVFTLYEWLDHMLSVSNNGAASVCWREAVLMYAFGEDYVTLTEKQADEFFKNTSRIELTNMAISLVNDPIEDLGISNDEWRLGSFFTRGADSYISRKGGSIGTTLGLMKFLVALEQGVVVDAASSLEIKRLLYMTDRRIRYASASALREAAVYFKSGSLYKCKEEEGYVCEKYKGNVNNFMNSVAIIEHPDGTNYIVVLMSNVLKINSGSEHQALAARIDKIIRTVN